MTNLPFDTLDNFRLSCNKRIVMDERLEKLEVLVVEQERTIEEMSSVIARQWSEIEMLSKKLELLSRQYIALEERTAPETPVTKPPHY